MPTFAKLLAAVWFGLIGWVAANAHIPMLGEDPQGTGLFRAISACIGVACGWMVMGKGVGGSMADAVGNGMKTSIIMAFFALLLFSGRQMIAEAMKMRFEGPMEAMLGWFSLMIENGRDMLTVGVLGALAAGGAIGGPIAEWAWRRWK